MNIKQMLDAWKSRFSFKPNETKAEPSIKFEVIALVHIADSLKGKVVCDVCEYHPSHFTLGKFTSWRGSTESEYFSIVFIKGMLTISVAERECQVGEPENVVNYAMSTSLKAALDKTTENARSEYNRLVDPKEQAEISFADVMTALNWSYKEGVKVDYDMLLD